MAKAYRFPAGEIFQFFSDNTYNGVLAATTEQTLTVPNVIGVGSDLLSQKEIIAVITINNAASNVFASVNRTVAVPVGAIGAAAGEIVPLKGLIKTVKVGDVIHIISSAGNTYVSIAFYQG